MWVEIQVISGPAKGQRFTFDKPNRLLFGRAVDAHISLPNDQYVSRQHFLLEIAPPECKLTDLNSKNGVVVNSIRYGGQRPPKTGVKQAPDEVKEVSLKNGDEIVVGDTHIKVFMQSDPGLPAERFESARPQPSIHCSLCGKDVTSEAGPLAQTGRTEYVCSDCRGKAPRAELTKILNAALTDKTT